MTLPSRIGVHHPQQHHITKTKGPLPQSILRLAIVVIAFSQLVLLPWILMGLQSPTDIGPPPPRPVRNQTLFRHKYKSDNDGARSSDGTFNGAPIHLREGKLHSHAHCVGENYRDDAWKYRSCHYHNLCLNTTNQQWYLFRDQQEQLLSFYLFDNPFMHASSTLLRRQNGTNDSFRNETTVAIGGLNLKWGKNQQLLQWSPTVLNASQQSMVWYEFDEDIVWLPFHSMNGANPGHLVWDDFMALYTLLQIFHLGQFNPLLLRQVVLVPGEERGLWASCDFRVDKLQMCNHMIQKFLPLFTGIDYPYGFSTVHTFDFSPKIRGVDLVCARHAAAGIGALNDHGPNKAHGWIRKDYEVTHNAGRGAIFYDFRNYMIQNMGLPIQPVSRAGPHKIVVSQFSSDIPHRQKDFVKQMEYLKKTLGSNKVEIHPVILKKMTLEEQVEVAYDASFFISLCGGGAVNGMFLPKGASVILYYGETGGSENNRNTGLPALLDWDVFNHMSHLRVHWMPRNTMDNVWDLRALTLLVQHEIELIESGVFE